MSSSSSSSSSNSNSHGSCSTGSTGSSQGGSYEVTSSGTNSQASFYFFYKNQSNHRYLTYRPQLLGEVHVTGSNHMLPHLFRLLFSHHKNYRVTTTVPATTAVLHPILIIIRIRMGVIITLVRLPYLPTYLRYLILGVGVEVGWSKGFTVY